MLFVHGKVVSVQRLSDDSARRVEAEPGSEWGTGCCVQGPAAQGGSGRVKLQEAASIASPPRRTPSKVSRTQDLFSGLGWTDACALVSQASGAVT